MTGEPITLEQASVLDVVAGELRPHHRVVIRGGIIERVEPVGAKVRPAGGGRASGVRGVLLLLSRGNIITRKRRPEVTVV